jgi:hypothetical protein
MTNINTRMNTTSETADIPGGTAPLSLAHCRTNGLGYVTLSDPQTGIIIALLSARWQSWCTSLGRTISLYLQGPSCRILISEKKN